MAKRHRSVSLSFVLLRFAIVMLGCMLLCCLAWYVVMVRFQKTGITYQGAVSNQQVEQMLAGEPKTFVSPGDDFLAEYALFGRNGEVLKSNVEGKRLEGLAGFLQGDAYSINVSRYTYTNGSTVIFRWHYRAEFVNPALRGMLPPAEYLGMATLGVALVLCLLFNTLWLRLRPRRQAEAVQRGEREGRRAGTGFRNSPRGHTGVRPGARCYGAYAGGIVQLPVLPMGGTARTRGGNSSTRA